MSFRLRLLWLLLAFGNAMPVNDSEKLEEINSTTATTYSIHPDANAPFNNANHAISLMKDDINKSTEIPTNVDYNSPKSNEAKLEEPPYSASFDSSNEIMVCETTCEITAMVCSILGWGYFAYYLFSNHKRFYRIDVNHRGAGCQFALVLINILCMCLYVPFIAAILLMPVVVNLHMGQYSDNAFPEIFNNYMFLHASFILIAIMVKCFMYDRGNKTTDSYVVLLGLNGFVACYSTLIFIVMDRNWIELEILFWLSFAELCIVLVKYLVQKTGFVTVLGFLAKCLNIVELAVLTSTYDNIFVFIGKQTDLFLGMIVLVLLLVTIYLQCVLYSKKPLRRRLIIVFNISRHGNGNKKSSEATNTGGNQLSEESIPNHGDVVFGENQNSEGTDEGLKHDAALKTDPKVSERKDKDSPIPHVANIFSES